MATAFMGPEAVSEETDAIAENPTSTTPTGAAANVDVLAVANGDCANVCCADCVEPVANCKIYLLFESCAGHRFDDFDLTINGVFLLTISDNFATTCSPGGGGSQSCYFEWVSDDSCTSLVSLTMTGSADCYCPGTNILNDHKNVADLDQFLGEETLSINIKTKVNRTCVNDIRVHVAYGSGCIANDAKPTIMDSVRIQASAGGLDHTILVDNPCCAKSSCINCIAGALPNRVKVTLSGIVNRGPVGGCSPDPTCSDFNGEYELDNLTMNGVKSCYYRACFESNSVTSHDCVIFQPRSGTFVCLTVFFGNGEIDVQLSVERPGSSPVVRDIWAWRKLISPTPYNCLDSHTVPWYRQQLGGPSDLASFSLCEEDQFANSTAFVEAV